ncbi:hypothetical protein TNCV_180851 [Trichonephila clavipes]|nr:hypothetical protein TNCV_180851 [Trichonephila clavipes]
MNRSHIIAGVASKHGMSKSADRMFFGVQPLSGSTVAICGPVRQNHICFLCVRVLCHRTASLCAMEIKLPFSTFRLSIWELEPRQIPPSHIWRLKVPCAAVLGSVVQEVWPLREGPMAYEEVGSRNTIGSVSIGL